MKRLLALLLCVGTCMSMFSTSFIAQAANEGNDEIRTVVAGDVNGDQALNGADLVRLKKYLSSGDIPIAATEADVDADGEVTGEDLKLLCEYLAGMDVQLRVRQKEFTELTYTRPEEEHIIADPDGSYYVDNEILLTVTADTSREQVEHLIQPYLGTITGCISVTGDYQISFPAALTKSKLEEIVAELNQDISVELAMIHELFETEQTMLPNDTGWSGEEWSTEFPEGTNWNVEAIHAPEAWDYLRRMSPVKVGLIDGMFVNHIDVNYAGVYNNPKNPKDSHGLKDAGIIGAQFNNACGFAGVAPNAKLYGYSILSDETNRISQRLTCFMEWKYALALLMQDGCRVINVSMVYTCYGNAAEAVKHREIFGSFLLKMLSAGYDFLIVESAGNNAQPSVMAGLFTAINIPAVRDRIIIVGAVGTNGSRTVFGKRSFKGYCFADFSNYGSGVDIVAPGVAIPCPDHDSLYNIDSYSTTVEGTSQAAPHVTGVAALCFGLNPNLTGAQVKKIIVNSCTSMVTDKNKAHTEKLSYPLLNAYEAVKTASKEKGMGEGIVVTSDSFIMGEVKAADGTVIDSVNISAYTYKENGGKEEFVTSTVTDSEGNFELIVPGGTYRLYFTAEDYDTKETVESVSDKDIAYVEVRLIPEDEVGLIETNVLVPDPGNMNPAIRNYSWKSDNRRIRIGTSVEANSVNSLETADENSQQPGAPDILPQGEELR